MFSGVSGHIAPLDRSKLPAYLPAACSPPQLNPWDVYAELKEINPSKAAGPDGWKPQLIREFGYEFSVPLTDILNSSYASGVVPSQWKEAIIVPIPKTSPPNVEKLRPVSLTPIFSKIAEGFICDWILEDIEEFIDVRQFGNVSGVSTSHYLVNLMHYLYQGVEKLEHIGTVVLTDFSKAFDLIDHTVLIERMIDMGVRRTIVPWVSDFLHNRQQCVRFSETLSDFVTVKGGVPQGTKLGPLCFQIIINSAAKDAKSKCWKYVDDMTFGEIRHRQRKGTIQNDLDDFTHWSKNNSLKLNPSKCQALLVNFGKVKPQHADLRIGNELLPFVDKAKVLGVWVQNDLKWDAQVINMLIRANKRLFMLRTLKKFGFSQEELEIVFKSYLRPILEYAAVVWHSSITSKQCYDIERIQKRACRIILGHKYNSYDGAISSCNLDNLADRRENLCLKFAQGLSSNVRTSHLIPPTRKECHGRNLRNSSAISQLRTRTARFENSPVPFFINLLNK